MKKKIISSLLAVSMLASVATATAIMPSATEVPNRGTIYFDSTGLFKEEHEAILEYYCYIWSSKGEGSLYEWQSNKTKMTKVDNNLFNYDIPYFNSKGVEIDADLMILSTNKGNMSLDITFNDDCMGDTLYVMDVPTTESPTDDIKPIKEWCCAWRNTPTQGAKLQITYNGKIRGFSLLKGETPESVVNEFIQSCNDNLLMDESVRERLTSDENRAKLLADIYDILAEHSIETPTETPTEAPTQEITETPTQATTEAPTKPENNVPTRGTIYFDSKGLFRKSQEDGLEYYCHIWSSKGEGIYEWMSKKSKMTKIDNNLFSYDIPSVNPQGVEVDADLMLLSCSNGEVSYDITFNDDCMGDTLYVMNIPSLRGPTDSSPLKEWYCAWRNTPTQGAKLYIDDNGAIHGFSLLEGETPEGIVDEFIQRCKDDTTIPLEEREKLTSDENRAKLLADIYDILEEHSIEIPTEAPTNATSKPTENANQSGSDANKEKPTDNTSTGKVATGDSLSIIMLIGMLMLSGATAVITRKRSN